jgi:hypothetical protein
MSANNANLNIRLPRKEREAFTSRAVRNGRIPSDVLRQLLRDYTKGDIVYPTQKRST